MYVRIGVVIDQGQGQGCSPDKDMDSGKGAAMKSHSGEEKDRWEIPREDTGATTSMTVAVAVEDQISPAQKSLSGEA